MLSPASGDLKSKYQQDVNLLKQWLEWVERDVKFYEESLISFVSNEIRKRKKKLLDDQRLVESLGIPIKKKKELSEAVSIPITLFFF